ncbi:amidohydrolase [Bacteroidota bacterium]
MKIAKYFLMLSIVFLLMNCDFKKEKVDLIVKNARVYTVDPTFKISESFAVKNGKFVAIGTNKEIGRKYISSWSIDAKGNPVYPGFIDSHCHFYGYGVQLVKYADLKGTKSFDEIIGILESHAKDHLGDWIVGMGWDQNDWEVKEFPENKLLDELFPGKAVMIIRIDGHAVIANSLALEKAGIQRGTIIPGGLIEKRNDRLTGLLLDNAADSLKNVYRSLSITDKDRALLQAQEQCFSVGLTSVTDAGLNYNVIKVMDALQQNGLLKMRIYAMLNPSKENIELVLKKGYYQTDRLNIRSVKLYADGALGSRGALLLEPYSDDPRNYGILVTSPEEIRKYCNLAYQHNFQVNTHAIGDSAIRMMLHIYSEFLKGENDLRWRIEHAQVVHEEDFDLFAENNIIPSIQTTHATSDMYWADKRLGTERVKNAYAYKNLLKQNNWIPNGTDFPIENISPIYSFYAAVFRKDLKGFPDGGYQFENALSREEALRAMTIWAAMGSFEEDVKGSIEAGKWADFVILDGDLMTKEEKLIPEIKIIGTYIAGEEVYKISL